MVSIPVRTCYCRRKLIGNYLKGFGLAVIRASHDKESRNKRRPDMMDQS